MAGKIDSYSENRESRYSDERSEEREKESREKYSEP